jgi:hypothetical protein
VNSQSEQVALPGSLSNLLRVDEKFRNLKWFADSLQPTFAKLFRLAPQRAAGFELNRFQYSS